jgi:hypothetical protein
MKKILSVTSALLFAVVFGSLLSSALGINAFIGVGSLSAASLLAVPSGGFAFGGLFLPVIKADKAKALEFKNQARVLSSFEGGANSFEGGANSYLGVDTGLSFVGKKGDGGKFVDEIGTNVSYGFSISNSNTSTKVIAINATDLATAANIAAYTGQTVDGILTDGTILTNVTGTPSNAKLKLAYLQNFIAKNPTRVVEMIIQSDTAAQFDEQIQIGAFSPFRTLGINSFDLTNYIDPRNLNDKKAIIPLALDAPEFQLDDQSILLIPVVAESTVKITFKIGLISNQADGLFTKAQQAYSQMKANGVINRTDY